MTREEAKEAVKEAYGNSEYTDEIIKALEQEPRKGKWIVKEESAYPCRGHMRCECDNCGYSKNAEYHDLAYGDTPKYIMPQFCEKCGNEKSNIVIYPTK